MQTCLEHTQVPGRPHRTAFKGQGTGRKLCNAEEELKIQHFLHSKKEKKRKETISGLVNESEISADESVKHPVVCPKEKKRKQRSRSECALCEYVFT